MRAGTERREQTRERAVVYDLGGIVEVDVGAYQKKGRGRRRRWRQTSETQKQINRQARKRYFRRKALLNFSADGMLITLTYDDEHLRTDIRDVQHDIDGWRRAVSRLYRGAGAELRAMWVYEFGESSGRAHIHVILNRVEGVPVGEVLGKWRRAHDHYAAPMTLDESGFEDLCTYLLKQEAWKCGYGCTRNLKNPEPLPEQAPLARDISRVFTKKRCGEIATGAVTRAELNGLFPGFVKVLDGFQCRYNVYSHTWTMHLRLLRPRSTAAVPAFARTREFDEALAIWEQYIKEKAAPLSSAALRGYVDTDTGEVTEL